MAVSDKAWTWIEIQQNTFTNWCNDQLKDSGMTIDNLVIELDDGVKLIVLLEKLSKKTVGKFNRKPCLPAQCMENLAMAFNFMVTQEKIPIVNIGPKDIQEHNQKLILSLIWMLILNYQILRGGEMTQVTTTPSSAKQLMLNWLQVVMPEDQQVTDLASDWNDGRLLSALVDSMKPGIISKFDSLQSEDALANTQQAMDIAESEFHIPQVIKPEHMCMDKPDELSVMTYLSYFCCGSASPGYTNLLEWVCRLIPECNIQNFTESWRNGLALSALVNAIAEGSIPNYASLDPNNEVDNVRTAMKTANDKLEGMRNSITPEEFTKCTSTLAMMGYIECFRKAKPRSAIGHDHPHQPSLVEYAAIAQQQVAPFFQGLKNRFGRLFASQTPSRPNPPSGRDKRVEASCSVVADLEHAGLISSEEKEKLSNYSDVIRVQSSKSLEVIAKTADVFRRRGFEKECKFLLVLAELQLANLVTGEECKGLIGPKYVVRVQRSKPAKVLAKTADVLGRHEFMKMSKFLAVLADLKEAGIFTSEESEKLRHLKDVIRIQSSKSPQVMVETAKVLRRRGLEEEYQHLTVCVVLADLQETGVITREESVILTDISHVVRVQSGRSPQVMVKTAEVLRRHGYEEEYKCLTVRAVLADLHETGVITSEESKTLTDISHVVQVQSGKSCQVMVKTAYVLQRHHFEKEFNFLLVMDRLCRARLIAIEECRKKKMKSPSDVVRAQRGKSPYVMSSTADILVRHGFVDDSNFLLVLADLRRAELITGDECKRLSDPSYVVRVQSSKSHDVMVKTANILRKHGFLGELNSLSVCAVLAELQKDKVITSAESERLRDLSDVIGLQSGKSHQDMAKTSKVLRRHGFNGESKLLSVLAELRQDELISCVESKRLSDLKCNDVVRVQSGKPPDVLVKTAGILSRHGFDGHAAFLEVLAELGQANLATKEERERLQDISDVAAVQRSKSPDVKVKTAEVLKRRGFERESKFLSILVELEQAGLDSGEGYAILWDPSYMEGVLSHKSSELFTKVANIMKKHGLTVLAKPHQADAETQELSDLDDVVGVQSSMSPPLQISTAEAVSRRESMYLSGQDLLLFEKHYSEVVSTQASVLLKITKCTTIGPPRRGKTCLKHLLTGQKWDVEGGTVSTDVMQAPEWVECYSVGDKGAEELWELLPTEQQHGQVLRAVICTPPAAMTGDSTNGDAEDLWRLPSEKQQQETVETAQSTIVGPPNAMPSIAPHEYAHTTSAHVSTSTGTLATDTIPTDPIPTTPPSPRPKSRTLMQGVKALACAYRSEALENFLKNKEGKVLGETRLIHFIDTGGQAIYHDVHPALITSPSIYLVVFSLKDLYRKSDKEQCNYFRSDLIQRPLRSIYTFGTKTPQVKGHPTAPKIFIVGTHLDLIPIDARKGFLLNLHKLISTEIGNKPYRQFVQRDSKRQSFWAVDNTKAGREQDDDFKMYVSNLRRMVEDRSMEMSVRVPLPWLLLKLVMVGQGVRYCKYSKLLQEACVRGYAREDSPDADLDAMLSLFHILGLIYHKVPAGCKKEDSLVFIDPDCLFSATSDFLMAAKEEIEDSQSDSQEEHHQMHAATTEKFGMEKIVRKNRVIQRMRGNANSIEQEMEAVLESVEGTLTSIGQEPIDMVLGSLHAHLKDVGQQYMSATKGNQDASSQKAKRQLFIGRLVHSLASTVGSVLQDSGRTGDVDNVKKEVSMAVQNIRARCEGRSIKTHDMDQFLAILSELRIIAQLSDANSYVVPAALPIVPDSVKVSGSANPIFFSVMSQTIMEVCYLPSGLFCCLISELVTGLGWTMIPLGRSHVDFVHKDITGSVRLTEHESYIEVGLESEVPLKELAQTCHTVRRGIHDSIVCVYDNIFSHPTADLQESFVWGFQCDKHPDYEIHVAAFRRDGHDCWTECLLQPFGVQDVVPEQLVWFSSELDLDLDLYN